ncbi:MAG: hypothetical protein JOZ62_13000 [Acidobacteriaceae bacterium]|nr:hypothetical protein [Acidobacteriaceae bacterium]
MVGVVVAVLLVGILIGLFLAWWFFRRLSPPEPPPPLPCPPPTPCPPPEPCPPPKIPDQFDAPALSAALQLRLRGTTADGSAASTTTGNQVIWVDSGGEVLVHLDSIQARILENLLLISIDLESDETGRTPLIVSFALGNAADPAGLVAATDEYPRGDGRLAAHWGESIQAALWSTLLSLAQEHATERGKTPVGISATSGSLRLQAAA